MDVATQTHLTALRDLLEFRRRELQADVHAAALARQLPAEAPGDDVEDRKDEAERDTHAVVDAAQERRDLDEMADVSDALARLDANAYGDCAECGEPIPLPRLLVQPAARRCADCQARDERRGPSRR